MTLRRLPGALDPGNGIARIVTLGGAALATLVFCACFSIRTEHEWRLFPDLLSYASGVEPHTNPKKTSDFLWTKTRAAIDLPLILAGNARIGIVLSSPAGPRRVLFSMDGAVTADAVIVDSIPTTIDFDATAVHRRRLGLSLDVTRMNARARGVRAHVLQLRRGSGWLLPSFSVVIAYAATLLLLVVVLGRMGFGLRSAWAATALLICLPASILAGADPLAAAHLCLRFLIWIPPVVFAVMNVFMIVARRSSFEPPRREVVRWTTALFMAALVLRGGWLLHPGHYHKDEPIHEQMPRIAMENGVLDLWRNIEAHQARHLLGETNVAGGLTVIRYPPTFYTLALVPSFAQRALGRDADFGHWNKLLAAIMSAAQILPILAVACRLGAWPFVMVFCGVLEVFSPVEIHELSCVALSATMGKLSDLILLSYLICRGGNPSRTITSALMLLCLMSYVGSWINIAVVCGLYMLVAAIDRQARAGVPRLAVAGVLAVVAACLLFYGDLWWRVFTVHLKAGYGAEGIGARWSALAYPSRWLWGEIAPYYSPAHFLVWLCGLSLTIRRPLAGASRAFWLSWNMALIALPALQCLGGRALEYFRSAHLTMALMSLCGGIVLSSVREARRSRRALALGLLAILLSLQIIRIVRMVPPFFIDLDAMLLPAWPF
ncbi:MAG: hypothetical protein JXO72_10185 [Vicinamibacteria bacterium]|nr:hypothetical protein [Vicinamibacteria bacterium]